MSKEEAICNVKEANGIIADEPHVCKYCPGENLCNLLGSLNTQCFKQREEIERLTKEVEAGRKLWADAQRARKVRALENDGLRGRISEHQAQLMAKDEEIKQLKVLLKVALCPNTQNGCKDGVYPDPYGQPCRCQWCDEVEQALKGK